MNKVLFLTSNASAMDDLFLGSGKAGVVVGVAAIILVGLLLWVLRAHRQLTALEKRLDEAERRQTAAANSSPITPQRS
jgi:hypothetical protein